MPETKKRSSADAELFLMRIGKGDSPALVSNAVVKPFSVEGTWLGSRLAAAYGRSGREEERPGEVVVAGTKKRSSA